MRLTPDPVKCPYCTGFHAGICPLIKAIEYRDDGGIRRVEFKTASDYPPVPAWTVSAHAPGTSYGGDAFEAAWEPVAEPPAPRCGWEPDGKHSTVLFLDWWGLKKLNEYSTSYPTGTTIGKKWKRDENATRPPEQRAPQPVWWLGEYTETGIKDKVGIRWAKIVVVIDYSEKSAAGAATPITSGA